jgi:hypothetical protein
MERGTSVPLLTAISRAEPGSLPFISPPQDAAGGPINSPVQSGDLSPRFITNRALSRRSCGLILVGKWYYAPVFRTIGREMPYFGVFD